MTRQRRRARPDLRTSADGVFQRYADRGVFRGFSASDGPRGLRQYRFVWLTGRPMLVTLAPARRVLTFARLFPSVDRTPGVAARLKAALADCTTRAVPAHRRLHPTRATIIGRVAGGDLSVHVTIHVGDGARAIRAALSIVNDLFQILHECYPDYLSAQFGVSDE